MVATNRIASGGYAFPLHIISCYSRAHNGGLEHGFCPHGDTKLLCVVDPPSGVRRPRGHEPRRVSARSTLPVRRHTVVGIPFPDPWCPSVGTSVFLLSYLFSPFCKLLSYFIPFYPCSARRIRLERLLSDVHLLSSSERANDAYPLFDGAATARSLKQTADTRFNPVLSFYARVLSKLVLFVGSCKQVWPTHSLQCFSSFFLILRGTCIYC